MSMRYSSRLYKYTISFNLPLHYSERRTAPCRFFLYHLQLAAMLAVFFCGEHDSVLAGDGAREWASRHGLATETVGGDVEKVRNGFQCTCNNQIVIRILNLPVSDSLRCKRRLFKKKCHCFSDVVCMVRNEMNFVSLSICVVDLKLESTYCISVFSAFNSRQPLHLFL